MGYAISERAMAREVLGKNGFRVVLFTMRGLRQVEIAKRLKMSRQGVHKHLRAAIGKCPRIAIHLPRHYSMN